MKANELSHIEDWLTIARKDWRRISLLLEEGDAEGSAIFLQQSLEKYMKAFLLKNGWKLRKIHDLVTLLDYISDINPAFEMFRDLCERVTAYYFIERYPPIELTEITVDEIQNDRAYAMKLIMMMFNDEDLL